MSRIAIVVVGVLLCVPAAARAEVVVNISKSQQRLAVTVDGAELYRWPVSTGTRRYPTPAGKFRPVRLERDWYSRKYNMTPMPYSIFFYRGYAVHGTLEARNLGRAASHGCVRLLPSNASILFELVREHGMKDTRIVVLNGSLPASDAPRIPAPRPPREDAPAGMAQLPPDKPHLAMAAHRDDADAPAAVQAAIASKAAEPEPRQAAARRARLAQVDYSVSVGGEARVLRERELWLRSLDRKYGIAR